MLQPPYEIINSLTFIFWENGVVMYSEVHIRFRGGDFLITGITASQKDLRHYYEEYENEL